MPFIGLVITFSLYLLLSLFPNQVSEQIEHDVEGMRSHLDTLAVLLVNPTLENDLSEIYTTLDELKIKNTDWDEIHFYNKNEKLLYPLDPSDTGKLQDNKYIVKITQPVSYHGESLGMIMLFYNTERWREELSDKFYILTLILISMILVSILIVFFIFEYLVRNRLEKLSTAANQLSLGIFDASLPKESSDEVGVLVNSFDLMRSNIQSHQLSLQNELEKRNSLQLELQKRTLELEDQKLALDYHSIVSISNESAQYTYVNDKLCEISGYSRDELIGMNQFMLLIDEDNHETFFTDIMSHLKDNNVWQGEVKNRNKNGKEFIAEMTIVPFFDKDEKLYQYISILTDVTDLKNIEIELRKSTQQVQNIIDSSPTILMSADPSGDFTLIFISDNVEKILGYHPDEVINHPNFWFERIHPDDRLRILPNILELFVDGRYDDDYRFRDKWGNYHWFNTQLSMIYNSSGEPIEIMGSLTDITERRYIDEALRIVAFATATASDEEYFHLLVSNLAQAFQVEYVYILKYANEEKTRLRTIASWEKNTIIENLEYDLIGTPCNEVMSSGDLKQYSENVQVMYPDDMYLKDHQVESYLGVPFKDSSGSIIGSLVVMDTKRMMESSRITSIFKIFASRIGAELERQKSRKELIQYRDNLQLMVDEQTHDLIETRDAALAAERAMSGFLANMSHELRTPLHGILSFSRFGIKKIETAPKEKLLDYFSEINDSGSNLLKLVNDLLDLSKLRAGKMVYDYTTCNINTLIQSLSSELYAFAAEKDIRFELCEGSIDIAEVEVDKERIMQVLRNIIVNAVKYSPNNTLVEINVAASENEMVQVSICDEGVGIPEDELTLIFEAFSQSTNTKTNAGGTGLGLPIVKEIVEQGHNGWIKAENKIDGGACFMVTIPKFQSLYKAESRSI